MPDRYRGEGLLLDQFAGAADLLSDLRVPTVGERPATADLDVEQIGSKNACGTAAGDLCLELAPPIRGQVCHADAATGDQLGCDPDVLSTITRSPRQEWGLTKII